MLDIKFIRDHREKIKEVIKQKNLKLDIDNFLRVDEQRKSLQQQVDDTRKKRNELAEAVGKTKKPTAEQIQQGKDLKAQLVQLEQSFTGIEHTYNELLWLVPQIPSDDTPVGADEKENVEVRKVGEIPRFDFETKDHIALGKICDIIDITRGVKVSGFRGYFLKNEGALLQMALMNYAIALMEKNNFTFLLPPILVKEFALYGTGYFPFGIGDNYEIANVNEEESGSLMKDRLYLAGTSEVSICAYHAEEILNEHELPKKYYGFSPCFRREVGSYGRDTKGLYRIHEFMKIEQLIICKNDYKESENWHQKMLIISETMLRDLNIPYRIIQICTGDMGAGKYKMFDIESWMPSRGHYGETHSASNLGDWQARRLNIKYRDKNGKTQYAHTLNNTVIASPRILISLLELNQRSDGSIAIPKILIPYLPGNISEIKPKILS